MASKSGNKISAIEEHYFDPEIAALYDDKSGFTGTPIRAKMDHRFDRRFEHAVKRAAPSGMGRRHASSRTVTEQHWQAIGSHYGTGDTRLIRPSRIRLQHLAGLRSHHVDAMHLA